MIDQPQSGPLAGVRVLDLTNVLAGPYCCYQLALMGAEVIKVERPGTGDLARQLGADPTRNAAGMGISFLAQNAGKKSVTLNFKTAEGKALLKSLVQSADVLVENFRPGVMDRLGLGYPALKDENPRLIYCAISGFGDAGPWKDNPAYDQIVQGVAGVMSITGDTDSAPLRVGFPLADTTGGMTAAFAVAASLNASPRGGYIDVSMTESLLGAMGWVVSNHLIGGVAPAPHGNENTTSAPSGMFHTQDLPINIAANRDEQWQALAQHLGRADLLSDTRFATREDRKSHRDVLRRELERVLMTKPADTWVRALNRLGVPTGPVLGVADALETEQIKRRDFVRTLKIDGTSDEVAIVGSPVMMNGARPHPGSAPPALGQDNASVWGALGISDAARARLKQEDVI